jgi:hypothetical protein
MELKHTPGPWEIKRDGSAPEITGSGWRGRRTVAVVQYAHGSEDPEVRANSHLIAAAPDLLEALKSMFKEIDNGGPSSLEFLYSCNAGRAAIAKSEKIF